MKNLRLRGTNPVVAAVFTLFIAISAAYAVQRITTEKSFDDPTTDEKESKTFSSPGTGSGSKSSDAKKAAEADSGKTLQQQLDNYCLSDPALNKSPEYTLESAVCQNAKGKSSRIKISDMKTTAAYDAKKAAYDTAQKAAKKAKGIGGLLGSLAGRALEPDPEYQCNASVECAKIVCTWTKPDPTPVPVPEEEQREEQNENLKSDPGPQNTAGFEEELQGEAIDDALAYDDPELSSAEELTLYYLEAFAGVADPRIDVDLLAERAAQESGMPSKAPLESEAFQDGTQARPTNN